MAAMAARVLGFASRHDPDAVTARLVEELEPRVNSESKRGEVHLIVHGARFLHVSLDGAGPVANIGASSDAGPFDAASSRLSQVKPGELADRYAASAAQTVRRLNPCAWHPTYRKSDLRHALCALLHAVLAPVAGARIPEGASDYTKRDWAEAVTTCREDVDKWLRSKEKKHAARLLVFGPLGTPVYGISTYDTCAECSSTRPRKQTRKPKVLNIKMKPIPSR